LILLFEFSLVEYLYCDDTGLLDHPDD
jgi:hypothetical protein